LPRFTDWPEELIDLALREQRLEDLLRPVRRVVVDADDLLADRSGAHLLDDEVDRSRSL
jgi:hypothetical protein